MRRLLLPGLIPALCLPLLAQTPELRTTAADRKGLSITIYQNDLAAVRDTRRVNLPVGITTLAFADLAAKIRSKSAYLVDPAPGLTVLERNFEFNLLSPTNLKLTGLGEPVALQDSKKGELQWGTQISVPYPFGIWKAQLDPRKLPTYSVPPTNSVLIQRPDGIVDSGDQPPVYRQVPQSLRASPTLLQTLQSTTDGPRDLTLLYTTEGLSWQAQYIATLDTDARHLDLEAFATVKNESGMDYPDTAFQLIAGQPNKVYDSDHPGIRGGIAIEASATVMVVGAPTFNESRLSEYPLFTLDRPTTLKDQQTKQLALFHAERIPMEARVLVMSDDIYKPDENLYLQAFGNWLDRQGDLIPGRRLEFTFPMKEPWVLMEGHLKNTKANHLGRALPGGGLDLRYRDPDGAIVPLDQQMVDGTPSGEDLIFPLPNGKGLSAKRVIRSLQIVARKGAKAAVLEVVVTFINGSDREIPGVIQEPFFQGWTMLSATLPGHRAEGNAYEFTFQSKPRSTTTLRYRVRTRLQSDSDAPW